jgi:hypothetical protein
MTFKVSTKAWIGIFLTKAAQKASFPQKSVV